MILRGKPDASIGARLFIHLARLAGLAIVILVVVELVFAVWVCLDDLKHVQSFSDVAGCALMPVLIFIWWQAATEVHLALVMILASAGTIFGLGRIGDVHSR
jgi:hypothetical protein